MKIFTYISMLAIGFTACNPNTNNPTPTFIAKDTVRTPEEELAGFKVPEGFIVELIASEKDGVINPIDITFDDAGRLWTQTAKMYPLDPVADIQWNDLLDLMNHPEKQQTNPNFVKVQNLYRGITHGEDNILVLSNLYHYHQPAVQTKVWADGLTIPMSILPYKNGAYVALGSEMFFLDDTDKDGKADKRDGLFTGFGFTDTHTMAHSLIRGPGGWIYFSHGALNKGNIRSYVNDIQLKMDYSKIARFTGDGKKMELVTPGLNNIWGFQLRANGQWYITEANDFGFSVVPLDPGSALRGIGNERFKPYQPWVPELHSFRVGGTGISGLAFADDLSGSFPAVWKEVAFLANPITNTINAVRIQRNNDGSISAEHLSNFLSSGDKYFRPVNIEFGPDGSLYVVDWYNKIISHNEIPTSDPSRDKTHGRIWRIRHVSQKEKTITNYYDVPSNELAEHLKAPSLWARRAALNQIIDRPPAATTALIPAITNIAADITQDESIRIHALWALEGLGHYDSALTKTLLAAGTPDNLKRETVRTLVNFNLSPGVLAGTIGSLVEDPNPMVRSQVLRTLFELGKADNNTIAVLLKACKPEIAGNAMGSSYERKFERYLALRALEQYRDILAKYLDDHNDTYPANLLWASMALPKPQQERWFLKAWTAAPPAALSETEYVMIANMLANTKIYAAVKPVFENPANAVQNITTALNNEDLIQSPQLAVLLQPAVSDLMKSTQAANIDLALNAIGRLKIKTPTDQVVALITNQTANPTAGLALRVLEQNVKQHAAVFARVIGYEQLEIDTRAAALRDLAEADAAKALQLGTTLITKADNEQKKKLVNIVSATNSGATLLKKLYAQQILDANPFSYSTAELIYNADRKDSQGIALFDAVKKRQETEKKAFNEKLEKYMAIAEKKTGDAAKGQIIFQGTCLMCHRVGDKGHDIAPALDGSANRQNDALLTAILDPDAAVEGGYEVFRVTKKDNSILEGYLYKRDDKGVTIAVMGGNKIFVPASEIKKTEELAGRSFMPKGLLDQYSDAEVSDLLAYIKTLQ